MDRKNKLIVLVVGAAMLAGPSLASAASDGWFIGARAGQGSVDDEGIDDSDTALAVTGGYRWGWLGLELGYVDFGGWRQDFQGFIDDVPVDVRTVAELQGFTAGVNVRAELSPKWWLSGRAGLFAWDTDALTRVGSESLPLDDDGNDWYAGVGVGYAVTEKFDLGLAYDHYRASGDLIDLEPDVISATAEFRF